MHELSICNSIVKIIEQQALTQHFQQVKAIWLAIGILAGIDKQALQFSFPLAVKNTLAEQAKLIIEEIPANAWCQQCQQLVTIQHYCEPCPYCTNYHLQIKTGTELYIQKLEVV